MNPSLRVLTILELLLYHLSCVSVIILHLPNFFSSPKQMQNSSGFQMLGLLFLETVPDYFSLNLYIREWYIKKKLKP